MAGNLTTDFIEFLSEHKDEITKYFVYPYLILAVVVYLVFGSVRSFNYRAISSSVPQKVLLITAHPDDECMFMAPVVLSLVREGHLVSVLCLTTGNYYGLGEQRKGELLRSCELLGVGRQQVKVEDNSLYPDDPSVTWDEEAVSDRLRSTIYTIQPNAVITFDSSGISGHINHKAVHSALLSLCEQGIMPQYSRVFCLNSVNILRKYVSILDLPLSYVVSRNIYVSSPLAVLRSWRAMFAHRSQLTWFRILYLVFSRYMLINTLTEVCHHGDC
ncbi:N-acetylglucosaminyl-phosphatidylinositol de-N-acetylase-like [Mizuhopecten yessoensis]|uniref:N-acetylglucosaminyl-phosphatidylinositol de-N-acetylase-like n=1 Tax=Mizuhopecten yessoensis TaxID=6573 RepID=UPI000B45BBEF|nr:N-acetylglucosaminyl-phosphatidylinositol de-N-acetylase-like [Mizuhopecten yessoensis]